MLNIRLVLFLIFLVIIQAEANNYFRGVKLNPASRIVNGKSNNNGSAEPTIEKNNDTIEFQAVKRVSGSKPVQGASPKGNQRPRYR
jgi:hypothetical protein